MIKPNINNYDLNNSEDNDNYYEDLENWQESELEELEYCNGIIIISNKYILKNAYHIKTLKDYIFLIPKAKIIYCYKKKYIPILQKICNLYSIKLIY